MSRAPWVSSRSYTRSHGNRLQPFQQQQLRAAIARGTRPDGTLPDATVYSLAARYGVTARTVYRHAARAREEQS